MYSMIQQPAEFSFDGVSGAVAAAAIQLEQMLSDEMEMVWHSTSLPLLCSALFGFDSIICKRSKFSEISDLTKLFIAEFKFKFKRTIRFGLFLYANHFLIE